MIVIVDYGLGNLASIQNMLKKIGAKAVISSEIGTIEKADKLILPGVGAFDNGMDELDKRGFLEVLNHKALEERVPILGICLGMQLLGNSSEEGRARGLGWIDAETIKFKLADENRHLKIPHMGWNLIKPQPAKPLFREMPVDSRFYFVHSYHLVCKRPEERIATSFYGFDFTSAVQKNNIMGVQFHPEKSHKFGMQLFQNFEKI